MSFSFRPKPAVGGRQAVAEEPAGAWSQRYKAMTYPEICAELARLYAAPAEHDYAKRRHFILQDIAQRTTRD